MSRDVQRDRARYVRRSHAGSAELVIIGGRVARSVQLVIGLQDLAFRATALLKKASHGQRDDPSLAE